ncbi:MAG TPA: DUF3046 domain-containing protein [Kineosporiaceae bacterium]
MSDFWILVNDEFGSAQGRVLVRDHVIGALGHRTAAQALEAGEEPRDVWFALCDDLRVPAERRLGAQDHPGARRGGRNRG